MDTVVCEGLGRRYGDVWGLWSATFSVEEGCLATLLGPNGAGKTTTVRILTTMLRPSRGRAQVLGYDVVEGAVMVRRNIAYLPQDVYINRNWTPYEAVKWFLVARGASIGEASRQAKLWLERLGLYEHRHVTCWRLSGGMVRRVLVAMVLAAEASVTFLDEPTTGLDVESRHEVWAALREIVGEGRTIFMTTHNMQEAETLSDEVIMISRGVTVVQGAPGDLLAKLPYRLKVVIRNGDRIKLDLQWATVRRLGDRAIVYVRGEGELSEVVDKLLVQGIPFNVDKVDLEDAYLYYVHGGEYFEAC